MNPHDETRDEEQIASLLAATEADAPAPDPALLARLRAASTEAFAASARPRRLRLLPRWASSAAAAVVLGLGAYVWLSSGATDVALGQVLANLDQADTLHARLVRGDQQLEYWHTRQPARSRWDEADGRYKISDGASSWLVDEAANQARRTAAQTLLPARQLLAALALPEDQAGWLEAEPSERRRTGTVELLVYRTEFPCPEGKIQIEAIARADTRRLQSITSRLEKAGKFETLGTLTVLAYDEPIDAQKFVVADTLTEDGRIGKVNDVQGIVSLKPVLHERWTPVHEHLVLRPGDWVRTDARGANAAALRLVKQTGLILGPKTLVELLGPKRIRLVEGEIEIAATAAAPIELLGPDKQVLTVKEKKLVRLHKQELVTLVKEPAWLRGFKGTTTNEALGSLVALVDGRNVPLSVGYHKVSVDIRDQIARTVIEESFVNHTDVQLEGVFHFPLPQDASISGFGMWIGNNLVEADVVEKQRAREIYETILRERRDPGLLEWSGGNIFKARVFPILAHSEKRIRITYTQVLPLRGGRYRYSYALQSELLQQHPLRELAIDVKVSSALPLKSVTSPTHPTRNELTPHAAHVEFAAQEYTPNRDFEVVVEVEGRQADVVLIPHRRGDDGYFMLQLTPPGPGADWDRPLLPDGAPLEVLLLADTSASIDAGQRAAQSQFIAALLSALTPKDRFNLATCDVTCDWAFAQPQPADAANIAAARDRLAQRTSLGWTNLDVAFAAALAQAGPKTHVIYIGDGIVTSGDADPVAFTQRLRRLYQGHAATFHAVSAGSSYESGVLKAIASLGGGSLRKITSEQGPAIVAHDLLGEIAQPGLRDVKVEFKGLKVARVYPEVLPNVPAGSQQIMLGRYLPLTPTPLPPQGRGEALPPSPPSGERGRDEGDQTGEVIVTGTLAGKPVRFSTQVSLRDAEQGNSFIPRLWARLHLDSLLEQGSSDVVKDEIIALSEEYQIITPYTSLLVLETDADRERFAVKRRFQMRDGERFFADGRDRASFDLAQQQMKKAGAWRTAVRRSVLADLARLGRDPRLFQPRSHTEHERLRRLTDSFDYQLNLGDLPSSGIAGAPLAEPASLGMVDEMSADRKEDETVEGLAADTDMMTRKKGGETDREDALAEPLAMPMPAASEPLALEADAPQPRWQYLESAREIGAFDVMGFEPAGGRATFFERSARSDYGHWLNTLFPPLPETAGERPESTWPAAARQLAKSLLRTDKLATLSGGLDIMRQTDSLDPRWDSLTGRARRRELVAAKSWLTRSESDGGQALISWCDAKEIGIFSRAFQLGRVRSSTPRDVQPPPLALDDFSLPPLDITHADFTPTLESQGKDRALLILKRPTQPLDEMRVLVDTARHVILSIEHRHQGKVTAATKFDDFVEAAGTWWARRIEATNEDGKRVSLTTQTIKTLTPAELDQQTKLELAGRASVQVLQQPLPSVVEAKKTLAAGKANFDTHFVLLLHFHRSQQWRRVFEHLQRAEALATCKPGLRWLRSALLRDSRRHEELRQRYRDEAARLAKGAQADGYFLAEYIVGQSAGLLQANEMLSLLDTLAPLYDRQPEQVGGPQHRLHLQASYLANAGRSDEALRLHKKLATDYPRVYSLQQEYAQALAGAGAYPAAYEWLTRVLVPQAKWYPHEEETLRNTYAQLLQQQGRYRELAAYLLPWVEKNPPDRSAYEQYLSALIKSDQVEKADTLALAWLKQAEVPDELPPAVEGRLHAAVYLMLGNGYQLYSNRVEPRWRAPLAGAVLFFARHKTHATVAEQIMWQSQFTQTEEAQQLRRKLAGILTAEVDKLPPEAIQRLLGWLNADDAEPAAWARVLAVLRQRWAGAVDLDLKHALGQALVTALTRHAEPADLLAFLRLQLQEGPQQRRPEYARQLFARLLEQPWTAALEAEAFTLLEKLATDDAPGRRLLTAVAALHQLTDALIEARHTARMKTLVHPEKLTRTELHKKQDESRRDARAGVADRLREEAAQHSRALARWLSAESLYLDLLLDRNLKDAATQAWEVVGAPQLPASASSLERALDEVLRQRYLVTLMNLAARKSAAPPLVERLLKYLDDAIRAHADEPRWKLAKYRLLVALDRLQDLEQALRHWTLQDDADSRWRLALGYLLAEQGRVADAIVQLEAVEAADELTPADYRAFAGWYHVQNQREQHERAAAAVYGTTPEHRLSQIINVKLQPWQRQDAHLPSTLDPEVLRIFAVLFERSAAPQSYLYQVRQFYQATHDFRLLATLADAIVGHTAERVYPFVQGMQSVLDEIRDEATADELLQRLAEVRKRAKSAVDQRALDLLEAQVERRAAEVQNQPGPHRDRAVAALERAFKRAWAPGEPRLLADYLAGLGRITQPALAAVQLRQLHALHAEAASGTLDRMRIAHRHAIALNSYSRRADAIDVLQAALDEFQAANQGVLPIAANDALASFISLLQDAGHYVRGEKVLLAQLDHPVHGQQRRWLLQRLDELYHHALQHDGTVSLGKDAALYQALNARLQKELADSDQDQRYQLGSLLCQVYRTAQQKKLGDVVADVRTFAFQVAPPLLKEQTNNHEALVSVIAHTMHELAGPRDGIAFLLNEIDAEPRWLRYNNQDAWSRHAYQIGDWRREAKDLGDVEGRLLQRVLAELRRDLDERASRTRVISDQNVDRDRYWKEKAPEFAKVAEEVLAQRSRSNAAVQYIADYFYWGLANPGRAIEVLFTARAQKVLDEAGEVKLVSFLHRENRHAESIPVLEPLVARRPDHLEYRILLMHAYYRTGRKPELLALLQQTDALFHEKERWTEDVLARLAQSTLQNELYQQSVAYAKELIPLHERTAPHRGIGDGALAGYYLGLANAYAGLRKTAEAVDAAGAAVVAWGPNQQQRTHALETLKQVLLRSPDLDAYALQLDKQPQDSAVIRKALGQAYEQKGEHAKAIKQLTLAVELQPNDVEVHRLLLACYDRAGDKQGAMRQLLQAVQVARRDLKLYEELGQRYTASDQAQEAERAYTSIVEMLPTEAESHTLLAEVREKQGRWADAIVHWEQVARLRSLEPTGLLKLAAAQVHERQWNQARATLRKLESRTWPTRFGDVRHEIRRLEEAVAKGDTSGRAK
jgi:Flp pilus assembly protein TadD